MSVQRSLKQTAFGRRPSLLHAVVQIEGRPPLRCLVHQVGDEGATIEFGSTLILPTRLRLKWEGIAAGADCEVRRTNGKLVEVGFTSSEGTEIARKYGGKELRPADDAS